VDTGEGLSPARGAGDRQRQRGEAEQRREMSGLGRERGKIFLKNRIWSHRTVYSASPVHTGQRTVVVR
jgi:hypothetical protein